MIVDAHQHLWRIGQDGKKYGHEWPTPDLTAIHRDFEVADLLAVTQAAGIDATVLVQSQPDDRDTDWMLEVAADTPLIKGVIGWADLAAPDAPARIAHLARQPKLKGLRPMLQSLPEDDWIIRDAVKPALKAMCDHGLSFDALVFTRHLPHIISLAHNWPQLAIVIDHAAKPPVAAKPDPAWSEAMFRVAGRENVYCKLSGLLTEMAPGQPYGHMSAHADHLYAAFGPDRLMWGSDWPVVLLRDSYRAWFDWTAHWLEVHPLARPTDGNAILGGTAARFYRFHETEHA